MYVLRAVNWVPAAMERDSKLPGFRIDVLRSDGSLQLKVFFLNSGVLNMLEERTTVLLI